eukprot:1554694-Lingulodinium_polyedra.AAC.1
MGRRRGRMPSHACREGRLAAPARGRRSPTTGLGSHAAGCATACGGRLALSGPRGCGAEQGAAGARWVA